MSFIIRRSFKGDKNMSSRREKMKVTNGAAILVSGLIVYAIMTVLTRTLELPEALVITGHAIGIVLELVGMYMVMKEYKASKVKRGKKK